MSSGKQARVTLVLGGARSGKSRLAERLIMETPGPWLYIATAEPHDDEMRARIAEHKLRRSTGWLTRDAPLDLPKALLESDRDRPILVDCLTLWLTNLMIGERNIEAATGALLAGLQYRTGAVVLVSNETGLGIVPDNALARKFRDEAGRLNQRVAEAADRVLFVAAGLPMTLKG